MVLDATAYPKCGDLYLDQGERWPQLRDVCILLLILCDAGFFTGYVFCVGIYADSLRVCTRGGDVGGHDPGFWTTTFTSSNNSNNHSTDSIRQRKSPDVDVETYWIHVWCRCWSNYKQLSKNQELAMRAMCVSCIFSSGATDGGWNSGNWCWNSLEEDTSSEGWDLFAIKLFEKEWFLAKKIEVWRMSFKKLGKGMQDSISTKYQDYHRFSLI